MVQGGGREPQSQVLFPAFEVREVFKRQKKSRVYEKGSSRGGDPQTKGSRDHSEGSRAGRRKSPWKRVKPNPKETGRGNDSMDLHVDALSPCHGSFPGCSRGKGAPSHHSTLPGLSCRGGRGRSLPEFFGGCEKDQGTGAKCRVRLLGCAEGEMSVPCGGTGTQTQPWGTKPSRNPTQGASEQGTLQEGSHIKRGRFPAGCSEIPGLQSPFLCSATKQLKRSFY